MLNTKKLYDGVTKELMKNAKMEVEAVNLRTLSSIAIIAAEVGELFRSLTPQEKEGIPLKLRVELANMDKFVDFLDKQGDLN